MAITEDYVSFETAKLLKEKGFDSPCMGRYSVRSREFHLDCTKMCNNGGLFEYAAPSQAMAMKWLREVHNWQIEISRGSKGYSIWIVTIPLGIARYLTEEVCGKGIKYLDTYESACEAAIKYCLENLI